MVEAPEIFWRGQGREGRRGVRELRDRQNTQVGAAPLVGRSFGEPEGGAEGAGAVEAVRGAHRAGVEARAPDPAGRPAAPPGSGAAGLHAERFDDRQHLGPPVAVGDERAEVANFRPRRRIGS